MKKKVTLNVNSNTKYQLSMVIFERYIFEFKVSKDMKK